MNLTDIKAHWENWAKSYGTGLRATTKASTAKQLEIDALARTLRRIAGDSPQTLLEVGCGNGQNCLALAPLFPNSRFFGFDYVAEMVQAANTAKAEAKIGDQVVFFQDDVMALDRQPPRTYDIIFTVRCLINLNDVELQTRAIRALCDWLPAGGHLVMLENSQQSYGLQNMARTTVGLPPRTPAAFNLFFDESVILPSLESAGMEVLDVEDYISFHDLVLYVLVPLLNNGTVDYEHPLVAAATKLNATVSHQMPGAFGPFGQSRLFLGRKRS
jgi:SAM-dependent methyltransferase